MDKQTNEPVGNPGDDGDANRRDDGARWTYRYVNDVPLRVEADPLHVNGCELTITEERDGRTRYHNAFVTNHPLV